MRLIKVEAQGFKSFADKVILTFDGDIVGIVGPNGSGKSNINDAIKWVLGEISPKSLRGDSMEDVIFAGSQTTPAMNKAIVSLTFDNSAQRISLDYPQIKITRILARGQHSQYLINDKVAKLKDVKEIVLESGISKTSLAIISQGTVQNIAEANPLQRRLVLEEAAGIAKYKSRKLEALRKLEKTKDNLEKITMVTDELNKQLKPLKKQAQKARIYLQKKQELEHIEVALLMFNINFYTQEQIKVEQEVSHYETQIKTFKSHLNHAEHKITLYTQQKNDLESEIYNLEKIGNDLRQKIQIIDKQIISFQNNLRTQDNFNNTQDLQMQANNLHHEIVFQKQTIDNLEKQVQILHQERDEILKIKHKLTEEHNRLNYQLITMNAKIDVLTNQKKSGMHLFYGVKTILKNQAIFSNLHGIVQDLIKINESESQALHLVLQNVYQHVVVNTSQDAVQCIKFLQKNNSGRATFILLNEIKPKTINESHYDALRQNYPGFIDVAANLVQYDAKYKILVEYLLGNVLVTRTIEDATHIFEVFKQYLIVTLDGNIIRPSGIMTGGAKNTINHGNNLDQEINNLKQLQPQLEVQWQDLSNKITLCQKQQDENNLLISTNHWELATLMQKHQQNISAYDLLKKQLDFDSIKIDEQNSLNDYQQNLYNLKQQEQSSQILLKTKKDILYQLSQEINQLILQKNQYDKDLRLLLEKQNELQIKQNHNQYMLQKAMEVLAQDYSLTPQNPQKFTKLKLAPHEAQNLVNNLKQEIKNLGHINLDALQDYDKIEARFQEIDSKRQELFEAKETIFSAIKQMDQIIVNKLHQSVEIINQEMMTIFKMMFGGGHALLKYTDPDNLLETGIEVEARPPGKTIKNIKLFSGGEKSLVAICLLFAILKSKPLPLCILDEVEAALDDVNVMRYAKYLQSLKSSTQFIVITHRLGTMTHMDKLFGVTMQRRGVTSFFSVKLSEAKNLIDEKTTNISLE